MAAVYVKICDGGGLSHVSNQVIDPELISIRVVSVKPRLFGVRFVKLIYVLH